MTIGDMRVSSVLVLHLHEFFADRLFALVDRYCVREGGYSRLFVAEKRKPDSVDQ